MTEQQRDRNAKHRLAIIRRAQEVTGNVAKTCLYFGVTRQSFYTLRRRYEERGQDGLRKHSWGLRTFVCRAACCQESQGSPIDLRPPPGGE